MRHFVTPGEELPGYIRRSDCVYFEGDKPYAAVLGFYDDERKEVVQLEGIWKPRLGDRVIGVVSSISRNGLCSVTLTDFASGLIIPGKFEELEFKVSDIIDAEVAEIERKRIAILQRARKLATGQVISVKPVKIPRIIGKNDTMIEQIAKFTGTRIVIGRNGVIWLDGKDPKLAIEAIRTVEQEAHTRGLTERIKEMLEGSAGSP